MTSDRDRVLLEVASRVPGASRAGCVLVAVDGMDGAGKTWFADELAAQLQAQGRAVIRASVDGFQHRQEVRYRRGRRSAAGYWLDAFDYPALRTQLLDPLTAVGTGRYRTASHDLVSDRDLEPSWSIAPAEAVLVFDGVFLHRDELRPYWAFSIFLDTDVAVGVARMADRDGGPRDPLDPRVARYVEAQRSYLASCHPASRSDLVIDNNDLENPVITASRHPGWVQR